MVLTLLAGGIVAPAAQEAEGPERPSSTAVEWSRYRGPNGTGRAEATGLPAEIGREKNVLWRTPLPPGHSSPVLSATRVFLTAVDDAGLATIGLDRESGEILWRKEVPREREMKHHDYNSPASPTPCVDGDTVVAFFQDFGLVAYDHDGVERWRRPMGPFENSYGLAASPVLVDGTVVLPVDQREGSFVLALRKEDGAVVWRSERPGAREGFSTPVVHDPGEGSKEVLIPGSFVLEAFDVATGARTWWVRGLILNPKSVPLLVDGVVYVSGFDTPSGDPEEDPMADHDADGDGRISMEEVPNPRQARMRSAFAIADSDQDGFLDEEEWHNLLVVRDQGMLALQSPKSMLAIRVGGRGDMTEESLLWAGGGRAAEVPAPVLHGNTLWMVTDEGGIVSKVDARNGDVLGRRRLEPADDRHLAAPILADGKVFFVGREGSVHVFDADGALEPLAVGRMGELCYATPAVADGRIYLRTVEALYCFGRAADQR